MIDGTYDFSILGHWKGKELSYELQILQDKKIIAFPFKSPTSPVPPGEITTLMSAKNITCKCAIPDTPGSRLFGEFSSFERDPAWLKFEGVTKNTKEVYLPLITGKVEIKNTESSTELNFDSKSLSGRWLMRSLPNIFDGVIKGENMNLLWKPETVESLLSSKQIKQEGEPLTIQSMMSVQVVKGENEEFDVIVAAEGEWTDRFGQRFIYTKEFINTLFTNMNMQVLEGKVPLGVDKEHSKKDNGKITKLELLDQPFAHIKGRGFFNGAIQDVKGASIDAEFQAFFSKDLQSWVPVNGITKRVSLVANPACKVCYFTPKTG